MLRQQVLASRETGTGIRGIFLNRFSNLGQEYGPVQVQTHIKFTYYTKLVYTFITLSLKMTMGLPWKSKISVSLSSS